MSERANYSWELERALLGGLILDPTQIPDVADVIRPGDLHRPPHAELFRILKGMSDGGLTIDLPVLIEEVLRLDKIQAVDGIAYVAGLPGACATVESIPAYAIRLRDLGTQRALEAELTRALAALREGSAIADVVATAGAALTDASEAAAGKAPPRFTMVGEIAREVIAEIHDAADDKPKAERKLIPTGFAGLDQMLIGFEPGDLVIVGGRSGMGKSAFVGNLAIQMATAGYGVAIHSAEMVKRAIVRRMLSAIGRASASQLRAGRVDIDNFRRFVSAAETIDTLPIAIDDGRGASLIDLRNRLRRLKLPDGRPVSVVAIDYLQLLRPDRRAGTRENDVSAIARGLKELAGELGVVMIALAQISRGVEGRSDKRPGMADLRESGEIEQAADAIMLLYRDDYYNPDTENRGVCECILAKLREGKTGTVPLAWLPDYLLFQSMVHDGKWTPTPPATPASTKYRGKGRPSTTDPDDGPMF